MCHTFIPSFSRARVPLSLVKLPRVHHEGSNLQIDRIAMNWKVYAALWHSINVAIKRRLRCSFKTSGSYKGKMMAILSLLTATFVTLVIAGGHPRDAFTRFGPKAPLGLGLAAHPMALEARHAPTPLRDRASPSLDSLYAGSQYLNNNTERL